MVIRRATSEPAQARRAFERLSGTDYFPVNILSLPRDLLVITIKPIGEHEENSPYGQHGGLGEG